MAPWLGQPVSIARSSKAVIPRPSYSTSELARLLHDLRYYQQDSCVPLDVTLTRFRQMRGGRSYVVLLSDFHDASAVPAVRAISLRHETLAILLKDKIETRPIRSGFVNANAAEDTSTAVIGPWQRPNRQFDRYEELSKTGASVVSINPEHAFDQQIQAFLRRLALKPWKERQS